VLSLCYTWAVSGFSLMSCVAVVYRVFYVRLIVYVLTILKEKIIIIIIIIFVPPVVKIPGVKNKD